MLSQLKYKGMTVLFGLLWILSYLCENEFVNPEYVSQLIHMEGGIPAQKHKSCTQLSVINFTTTGRQEQKEADKELTGKIYE